MSARKIRSADTLDGNYWSDNASPLKRKRSQTELDTSSQEQPASQANKAAKGKAKGKAKPPAKAKPATTTRLPAQTITMQPEYYRVRSVHFPLILTAIRDGAKVAIWYNDHKQWYTGTVQKYEAKKETYQIAWDQRKDQKKEANEWLSLDEARYVLKLSTFCHVVVNFLKPYFEPQKYRKVVL